MGKPEPTKHRESHPDTARLIDALDDRGCRCYIDIGQQTGEPRHGETVIYERCRCWNTNAGGLWLYERWQRVGARWQNTYSEWSRPIPDSHRLGVSIDLLAGPVENEASTATG